MPAPGSMYGEAAQLLEGAAQTGVANTGSDIKRNDTIVDAGNKAAAEAGASQRQSDQGRAAMALEAIKAKEKMVTITPQIALGLAKNTGDKAWLEAIGQDMRPDALLGLYSHGMALEQAKKAPKITQVYGADGKVRHAVVFTDDQGNVQQHLLDEGMKPTAFHPTAGGPKDTSLSKADKQFMSSHEKDAAFFGDAAKSEQLKATNPEEWNRRHDTYLTNQDRYAQLREGLGKGGAAPAGGGGPPAPDNSAPFDADAFIQSTLGDVGSRGSL